MPRLAALLLTAAIVLLPAGAMAAEGVVVKQSNHSVEETIDRLESALSEAGLTIFARIDHAAGAEGAGLSLRPTTVLIFGNPNLGTPLMAGAQTLAIDLPQKALAYEDENGDVFLAYNDPAYLAARHGLDGQDEVLARITGALGNFTDAAVE